MFSWVPIWFVLLLPCCCVSLGPTCVTGAEVGHDGLTADEKRLLAAVLQYNESLFETGKALIAECQRDKNASGLRRVQGQLRELRRQPFRAPKLCTWKLQIGGIGYLVYEFGWSVMRDPEKQKFKVLQVVDGNNMLIHVKKGGISNEFGLGPYVRPETIIWVSGVSTAGVTDDAYITLPQLLEVTGTKQYRTLVGTKTVFVVSPFPLQDLAAVLGKAAKVTQPPQEKRSSEAKEIRTWNDATGRFSVQAKFGGIIAGGKVVLVKEDGSKVHVTRGQLSKADNKYIDELTKK